MQMIGVGQLYLAAQLFQIKSADTTFDCCLGAHIHKNRGLNYAAMAAAKFTPSGPPFLFDDLKHGKLLLKFNK